MAIFNSKLLVYQRLTLGFRVKRPYSWGNQIMAEFSEVIYRGLSHDLQRDRARVRVL
jgi:hypothetical protein